MTQPIQSPRSTPFWDSRYETLDYIFGTEPNDFLKESAPHLGGNGEALCLGEGEGRNAVFLAQQGLAVTAVDMSATGLKKAQSLAQANSVSINTHVADLANFEFGENMWNGIVSIFCHLPPALRISVHKRVVSALRPGGLYILEAYTPRQLAYKSGGPSDVAMLYELADLRSELMGLEIIVAREVERDIQEGFAHQGTAAVVQILARKPD